MGDAAPDAGSRAADANALSTPGTDADTLEYANMDTHSCTHAVRWERHADTGGLYCSDCGVALTVSKPQYAAKRLQPRHIFVRAATSAMRAAGAPGKDGGTNERNGFSTAMKQPEAAGEVLPFDRETYCAFVNGLSCVDQTWTDAMLAHDAALRAEVERLAKQLRLANVDATLETAEVSEAQMQLAGMILEMGRAVKRADAAEAKCARLEKVVEEAPHDAKCETRIFISEVASCDCWKSSAAKGAK